MSHPLSQRPGASALSPEYLESLHRQWKSDPASIDEQWRAFFQGFEFAGARGVSSSASDPDDCSRVEKFARVASLIYHYRDIGHLMARIDPLGVERPKPAALELGAFDLTPADLECPFPTTIHGLDGERPLGEVIEYLERVYCGTVGFEYIHIQNTPERRWIQQRIEPLAGDWRLPEPDQLLMLQKLHQAEMFENFLHTRFVGQKRFSLEGAETLIPMLWFSLEHGAQHGLEEAVIGMAHRGRLNVLANIMQKGFDDIFAEFEDNYENLPQGAGDVKYHKGYSSYFYTCEGREMYLTLVANPSHLEAVNPVVEGRARAKQRTRGDKERRQVIPILIHGDAAFSGQGVVAETLQMTQLRGYTTGGTLHFIVNNQIGFTTSPVDARSSVYCTDVAKMVQAPIFHVNAEDPDACAFVTRLAIEYRQEFGKDVVIDLWCYRRHGHNEGDEPAYTQPLMYETIRKKKSICSIYTEHLTSANVIDGAQVAEMQKNLEEVLDAALEHGKQVPAQPNQQGFQKAWKGITRRFSFEPVETVAPVDRLRHIASRLVEWPDSIAPHKKLVKQLQGRRDAVLNDKPLDWGTVEALAFGSLVIEGVPVRVSGQDSGRGTFSHRHAVLHDSTSAAQHIPLQHLTEDQATFCIYDSLLSEASVVGFEYGYSLGDPGMLIIWEAQFGDFANGAQVIFDQFLSSAEAKWDRTSGLVLLLPHGYEGQGPEHSSARLERFLQLCAEDNMQVANLSTPAQLFHVLRRQMKRNFRKPLIIMSPKSLLRHPRCTSTLADLSERGFQEIIDDPFVQDRDSVRRVLFCTGKIYYDLWARRDEVGGGDAAVVRIEQIYPLHADLLRSILDLYPNAEEFAWVQEEPKNMGAWNHMRHSMLDQLGITLKYIGRPPAPSPAVGSHRAHEREQADIMRAALPAEVAAAAEKVAS